MNSFHTYAFPNAKSIIVCGDIHGEFNAVIYKLCIQYQMTELLPEIFMEERKEQLVKVLEDLRDAISGMQDAFVGGELSQMQQVLAQVMAPAFTAWREEARQHLLTWAAV